MKFKRLIGPFFTYLIMIGGSFLFLLPLVWMVSTSLKGSVGLFDLPPKWIPKVFEWRNYVDAVNSFPFLRYTLNTTIITTLSVVGGVLSSSFIAYSFAKLKWPGRDIWFVILITTMMLPPQVTMIPLFILFKEVGWINTYLPLTVPYFFGSAFYIFLMRQFYMTIPKELSEAAKIDGCSEFRIWWNIYVPLSKSAMATLAIFIFMFAWNDFLGPLIYLNEPNDFTLALGLRGFQQQFGTRWNVMMAASIIVMLPTLLLFFFFQKYFIKGVAMTGVKG